MHLKENCELPLLWNDSITFCLLRISINFICFLKATISSFFCFSSFLFLLLRSSSLCLSCCFNSYTILLMIIKNTLQLTVMSDLAFCRASLYFSASSSARFNLTITHVCENSNCIIWPSHSLPHFYCTVFCRCFCVRPLHWV